MSGGAAPVMRVNGQMYARLMRQSENIWLFSDSEFSKLYASLSNEEWIVVENIRTILQNVVWDAL